VISGIGLPSAGSVRYRGQEITYLDAERRLRHRHHQIPGGRAVFGPLTSSRTSAASATRWAGPPLARRVDRPLLDAFPRLAERRNSLASTLLRREQQMLACPRRHPPARLLLIDEAVPRARARSSSASCSTWSARSTADGTAVVLVEQSVNIALNLVEHRLFHGEGRDALRRAQRRPARRDDLLRAVFLQAPSRPGV